MTNLKIGKNVPPFTRSSKEHKLRQRGRFTPEILYVHELGPQRSFSSPKTGNHSANCRTRLYLTSNRKQRGYFPENMHQFESKVSIFIQTDNSLNSIRYLFTHWIWRETNSCPACRLRDTVIYGTVCNLLS